MNTSKTITIRSAHGDVRTTIGVNEGAQGVFSLAGEDYITLPFNTHEAVDFRIGDWADLTNVLNDEGLGGKFNKVYELVQVPSPTYDLDTDALHYDLRLDAYYQKWKNKLFKFIPSGTQGDELTWTLTDTLHVHIAVVLRNLYTLGYDYRGTAFQYDVQEGYGYEAKTITYDNTNILDALNLMAQEWECEWWVTENYIHFGKYEHSDAVKIEIGVEASEMSRGESSGTFATRLYVFGADRNIPKDYRPSTESLTINGVVQKRLMLPAGTPYIDAYRYDEQGKKVYIGDEAYAFGRDMDASEAVEAVVVNDDIYPRQNNFIDYISTYQDEIKDENDQPTGKMQTFYIIGTSAFTFKEEMIIKGKELQVVFKSGLLNGMTFGATFRRRGEYVNGVQIEYDSFELVAEEQGGTTLPNDILKPQKGDQWLLSGWDSTQIAGLNLISDAEDELLNYGKEYVKRTMVDDGTYTTTLMSHWVHEDMAMRSFDAGQRIALVNRAYFDVERLSRVIGYTIKLDLPYDAPQYTIGESVEQTRISAVESKVDALAYDGRQFEASGGSGVYLITLRDTTAPSITNAYSALRSRAEFMKRTENDATAHHIGMGGATIDSTDSDFFDWLKDGLIEVTPYIARMIRDTLATTEGDDLLTEDNFEILA